MELRVVVVGLLQKPIQKYCRFIFTTLTGFMLYLLKQNYTSEKRQMFSIDLKAAVIPLSQIKKLFRKKLLSKYIRMYV